MTCLGTAWSQESASESNLTLLDTESPDVQSLAESISVAERDSNFQGLNAQNRQGVFQSLGLSTLATRAEGGDAGFRLIDSPGGRDSWQLSDLTDPTGDLFLTNDALFQPLPSVDPSAWSLASGLLSFPWLDSNQTTLYDSFAAELNDPATGAELSTLLFKRFGYPKSYEQLSAGDSGANPWIVDYQNINSEASKLVIVLHGWQASSHPIDPYQDTEFAPLLRALHQEMAAQSANVAGWDLYAYNWAEDGATGGPALLDEADAAATGGLGTAVENATQAAEIAYQHGLALGSLIRNHPTPIEKVQIIAHGAGVWAARSLSMYLNATDESEALVQQTTLLDPYNPSAAFADWTGNGGADSVLATDDIDSWPTDVGAARAENIFSIDFFITGTDELYWGGELTGDLSGAEVVNLLVGASLPGEDAEGLEDGEAWNGHGGPIAYYAHTVDPSDAGTRIGLSLFDYRALEELLAGRQFASVAGWWQHSLFGDEVSAWLAGQPTGAAYQSAANGQYLATASAASGDSGPLPSAIENYSTIAVDVSDGIVFVMLVADDRGPALLAGPARLQLDGSFAMTLPDGRSLQGQFDLEVAEPTLAMAVEELPVGQTFNRVSGASPYAGFGTTIDDVDQTQVVTLALLDGTALAAATGRHPGGETWLASAVGAVDGAGALAASGANGFSLAAQLEEGGGHAEGGLVLTAPQPVDEPDEPVDYDTWISLFTSIPANLRGREDDPDNDGRSNLAEFYHGTSPLIGNIRQGFLDVRELTASSFKVRFERSKLTVGLNGVPQWSLDLQSWIASGQAAGGVTVTITEQLLDEDEQIEFVEWSATADGPIADAVFVRALLQEQDGSN